MKFHTRALKALNEAGIEARIDDGQIIITILDAEYVLYTSTKYWGRTISSEHSASWRTIEGASLSQISTSESVEMRAMVDTLTKDLNLVVEPYLSNEEKEYCFVSAKAVKANCTYILYRKNEPVSEPGETKMQTVDECPGGKLSVAPPQLIGETSITKTDQVIYYHGLKDVDNDLDYLKLTKCVVTPEQASKIENDPTVFPMVKGLLHILFGNEIRVSSYYVAISDDVWQVELLDTDESRNLTLSPMITIPGVNRNLENAFLSMIPVTQYEVHDNWCGKPIDDLPLNISALAFSRLGHDCTFFRNPGEYLAINPAGVAIVIKETATSGAVTEPVRRKLADLNQSALNHLRDHGCMSGEFLLEANVAMAKGIGIKPTGQKGTGKTEREHKEAKMSYKLTDLHGDRGVICGIWPDEQLPKDRSNTMFQGYEVPIMKESEIAKTDQVMYFRGLTGTETGLEVLKLTKCAATPVQASKIVDDPHMIPVVKGLLRILFGRDVRASTKYIAVGRDVWHGQLVADVPMETLSSCISIPGEYLGGVAIFSVRPMCQEDTRGEWLRVTRQGDVPSSIARIARSRLSLKCDYYQSDNVWYVVSPEGSAGIVITVDSVYTDVTSDILDKANTTMEMALRDMIKYMGVFEQCLSVFKDLGNEPIKEETKMEFELTDIKRVYSGFEDSTKRLILTKCVATPEQAKAVFSLRKNTDEVAPETMATLHILFGADLSIQNGYVSTGDKVWHVDTIYDTAYSRERVTDTVHIDIPFIVEDTAYIVRVSPMADFQHLVLKHGRPTTNDQGDIIRFVEHQLGDDCKYYLNNADEIVAVNAYGVAVKISIGKKDKVTSLGNLIELKQIASHAQESLRAQGTIPFGCLIRFQYLVVGFSINRTYPHKRYANVHGSRMFSTDDQVSSNGHRGYRPRSAGRSSRDVAVISLPLAKVETFIGDRSAARDRLRDVMRSHDVSNRVIEIHGLFVVTGFRENQRGFAIEIKSYGGEFVVYVCDTELYNVNFEAQLQFAINQDVTITDLDLNLLTDDLIIL